MPKFIDLTGQRFGRWLVLSYGISPSIKRAWLCRCDCGVERSVLSASLRRGVSTSCGCYQREDVAKRARVQNRTHGYSSGKRHPVYGLWKRMRQRCRDSNCDDYADYGARGVRVCERWNDFTVFLADMGERPSPRHSIDRIDPSGNYEPANCRWATPNEQARNAPRNNVINASQAALIKQHRAAGETARAISEALGTPFRATQRVAYGETWRDD